jgi:hypothetical protein
VATTAISIIEGDIGDIRCVGGGYPFDNLAPLTDGTLAAANPDRFYGARPEQLNRQIRNKLSDHIVPSVEDCLPMMPNFFLEVKGPDGTAAVATRQACHDGALGARGMHSLQSYSEGSPVYDNKAYTITSTYLAGTLKMYTTHLTGPKDRPEYFMTQLNSWSLTGNSETCRQGITAYRNGRDLAKEWRDRFIETANEAPQDNYTESQSGVSSISSANAMVSIATAGPEPVDSDTSDGAEFGDARQWSFTDHIRGEDEEDRSKSKKQKVRAGNIAA